MAAFPRCAASLRDGTPCGHTIAAGSEFCPRHLALVEKHGAEALKQGTYRSRKSPRTLRTVQEPLVVEVADRLVDSGNGNVDPASVRPRLAEAAAASLDAIQHSLLDAALGATREHWVTVTCSRCDQRQRVEVSIPDVRARVAAIELLLKEGLGRAPQAEERPTPRLPEDPAAVQDLPWEDIQVLFATLHVDEVAAALRGDGRKLLRERLAALRFGERRVLRAALLEPELT